MSVSPADVLHSGDADPLELVEIDGAAIAARSPLQLFWRRLRADRVSMVAVGVILLIAIVAIFAPLIVKILGVPGPNVQNSTLSDAFGVPDGPSGAHPFGVDTLGRDVLARTLYGARVSLEVGVLATGIAVFVGIVVGMLAGFYRGWVDTVLSRFIDVLLSFPTLLLALGLASACQLGNGCLGGLIKPGLTTVVIVIALVSWTYVARIVRGQVLTLREKEFVEASRSLGASNRRIMFREILPNLIAPIIVYASLLIPANILFEAALSFLGVGVNPPTASWGAMIADASSIFDTAWWYMLFPGVGLLITVLAFNLLGDGLQDALNPKGSR
ncbi:MAG: peptide/nickel transport system permease protein [Solirubrobacteraceae bacterium]|nr:peptide/nickel transport system permease protein [Solirubrobacteraceae bacterium]